MLAPTETRIHHMQVRLYDSFPDLRRPSSMAAVLLVAWLYQVWVRGSVANARGWVGFSNAKAYRLLWDLEWRLGEAVYVRFRRPFTLTERGEQLIRRYCGQRISHRTPH